LGRATGTRNLPRESQQETINILAPRCQALVSKERISTACDETAETGRRWARIPPLPSSDTPGHKMGCPGRNGDKEKDPKPGAMQGPDAGGDVKRVRHILQARRVIKDLQAGSPGRGMVGGGVEGQGFSPNNAVSTKLRGGRVRRGGDYVFALFLLIRYGGPSGEGKDREAGSVGQHERFQWG